MLSQQEQAKLKWRCRRGMLELDVLLARFCEQRLALLTSEDAHHFEQLLQLPDPDLLACLMGYAVPIPTELRHVVTSLWPDLTI